MKLIPIITLIILTVFSCKKDNTSKNFELFYKVSVDGQIRSVYACGTSDFTCQFLKDTAMFVGIGCGGEGAGFFLKGTIRDGTYNLNNINQAFYSPNQSLTYKTNSDNKGTLSITTGSYNGITTLKGVFEFKGIDTITGKTLTFSNGSFLMKKIHY